MNLILLGSLAGGASGALGFFLAGKFHGKEKGEKCYPLYSVLLFGIMVLGSKFLL